MSEPATDEPLDRPYQVPASALAPPKREELLAFFYPFELRIRALGGCQFLLGAGAAALLWPGLVTKFVAYFADPSVVRAPFDIHRIVVSADKSCRAAANPKA
jgi:hypothetical protein